MQSPKHSWMTTLPAGLLLATLLMPVGGAAAADWPQWRGQNRDGRSPETGLMQQWPEGGPPLAWKTSGLGGGFSSVAVTGGRIFTLGDMAGEGEDGGQFVIALDEDGGKMLWKTRIGPMWDDQYLGPRSTPTVDGDRLYALSTEGDLVCLDVATGKQHWHRSLPKDFGGEMMSRWKFAESPLVDGEKVVVTPGAPKAALVALDKMTGKEIWRSEVPALGEKGADGAGYASIVISNGGGVRQYVQLMGRGVVGVEAATGRFLWGYNKVANHVANIATPLVDGDRVFASTGYQTGSALIALSPTGGKTQGVEAKEVYFLESSTLQNHHGGLILHEGHVYTGTGHNRGFPISVELASGKVAWGPERNEGENSAAIAYADGRLYFRYQDGLMLLVEATPAAYREHGSFKIPDVRHPSWPHPVISGGKLYLREQDNLYCYDVKQPQKAEPKAAQAAL